MEGSSRQRAFHKDYALRKASKDLGAWFVELQAEVSDLVKLADAQYYDVVHPVSDPLPVAAQPQQPLFPPELHEAEKGFLDIFHTMKTKLDIVATAAIRKSSWLTRCKVPKCDLIVFQEMYDTARKIEDNLEMYWCLSKNDKKVTDFRKEMEWLSSVAQKKLSLRKKTVARQEISCGVRSLEGSSHTHSPSRPRRPLSVLC